MECKTEIRSLFLLTVLYYASIHGQFPEVQICDFLDFATVSRAALDPSNNAVYRQASSIPDNLPYFTLTPRTTSYQNAGEIITVDFAAFGLFTLRITKVVVQAFDASQNLNSAIGPWGSPVGQWLSTSNTSDTLSQCSSTTTNTAFWNSEIGDFVNNLFLFEITDSIIGRNIVFRSTILVYDFINSQHINTFHFGLQSATVFHGDDLNPAQIQILEVKKESVCFIWGRTDSGAGTQYGLRLVDLNNATVAPRVGTVDINESNLDYCFNNLEPGTLYELQINVTGTLEAGTKRCRTKACGPLNLREVLSFHCSITIAWDPADGQADAYRLYYKKTDSPGQELKHATDIWPGPDQALQFTLEDLDPETGYEFQVATFAGGELQEISNRAVLVVSADMVTLSVTQAGSVINVTWPSIDGGAPINELYHSPDDGDQPSSIFIPSTGQRLVALSGLKAFGQQYNLVLNAVSQEGMRTLAARTCFTLQPPPIPNESIQIVGVTGEPQTAKLRLNNPELGNGDINFYRILATNRTAGAGAGNPVELEYIVPFSACPEIRLTGLCPETFYVITIYTLSGTTLSAPVTSTFQTPPAFPGEISFGTDTLTSIQVYWAGGSNVDYIVSISESNQVEEQITVPSTDARTYIFESLFWETLYTVKVSATGSRPRNFLDRKSFRTRPFARVIAFNATYVGHNSITVNWALFNSGVDGYEVCYFDVADQVTKSYDVDEAYTESTLRALLPESVYAISVASYIGNGTERSTFDKRTIVVKTAEDLAVPPPVSLFVSSFGTHDVTLQWKKPVKNKFDYFLVEYTPDDTGHPGSPVLLGKEKYTLKLTQLISDTNYVFTVTALRGRAGLSEERSLPVTAFARTGTLSFVIETLEVTDTRIEVTWGANISNVLSYYEVTYTPQDGFMTDPTVAANETRVVVLQNLQPDSEYHVVVTAKNVDGGVLNVAMADLRTLKLPVGFFKAKDETTSSVHVYWQPAVDVLPSGPQLIINNVHAYSIIVRTYSDYRGPGAPCQHHVVMQSACPSIILRGLYAGKKYYVTVFTMDANGTVITSSASIVVETLPHVNLNLHVTHADSNSIEVAWSPASGEFSNYHLYYTPTGTTFQYAFSSKADERKWKLEGLVPGTLYTVTLQVQSIAITQLYSSTVYQFTTPMAPSYVVFNHITDTGFNVAWPLVTNGGSKRYSLCVFPDPKNISVADVYGTTYDLENLIPSTNHLVTVHNVVYRENGQEILSLPVSDYQETSPQTTLPRPVVIQTTPKTQTTKALTKALTGTYWTVIIASVSVLVLLVIIIGVVVITLKCRRKNQTSKHVNDEQNGLETNMDLKERQIDDGSYLIPDQLENDYEAPFGDNPDVEGAPVKRTQLNIIRELGRGQYGRVLLANAKGLMLNTVMKVAVKTTKDSAPQMEKDGLLRELSLMRKMKRHTHVVGILGWCVETEPYYLILEYMDNGNLKDFLMKSRKENDDTYSRDKDVESNITRQQLMNFAKNVADGMNFIASNKCVHRDLAARNVLVDHNLVCKVSDFGLARDIMSTEVYERQSDIPLPIRWMALECLVDGVHTIESDVWSFGILLWEIITLGARPYPGMGTKTIIRELKQGIRMPKPTHCKDEVFILMLKCWEADPSSRPSFEQIIDKIERVLDIQTDYLVLDEIDDDIYDDTAVIGDDEKV